jgi:hypothetical protein
VTKRAIVGMAAGMLLSGLVVGACREDSSPAPQENSSIDLSVISEPSCPKGGCGGGFHGCVDSDGNNPYVYGNVRQYENGQVVEYHADVCGSNQLPVAVPGWVVEWICYPTGTPYGTPWQASTNCPNGCYLGKCRP